MTCELCVSAEELLTLADARLTRDLTAAEREEYLHEPATPMEPVTSEAALDGGRQ